MAVWLLVEVGKRVGGRALDEVANAIYSNVADAGRPLLTKLVHTLRGNDPHAIQAAAANYERFLENNPGEGERVVGATLKSISTKPINVIEAITRVMCQTAAKMQTVPPSSGRVAGVAAFAGSFPSSLYVTVIDVREENGSILEPPEQVASEAVEPHLFFSFDFISKGMNRYNRPRMWVVIPNDPHDRDAIVAELNASLLDKHDSPSWVTLHLTLPDLVGEERAKVRRVWSISSDRVQPYYPDPTKDSELAAAADQTARTVIMMRPSEVDKLKKSELRLFDIADTKGSATLLRSIATAAQGDAVLRNSVSDDWGKLGDDVGGFESDESD